MTHSFFDLVYFVDSFEDFDPSHMTSDCLCFFSPSPTQSYRNHDGSYHSLVFVLPKDVLLIVCYPLYSMSEMCEIEFIEEASRFTTKSS